MATKKATLTPEQGMAGFDNLSKNDFIDRSDHIGTGMMSSQPSGSEDNGAESEDPQVNAILAAASKLEKEAKKSAPAAKKANSETDVAVAEEEEEVAEEEVEETPEEEAAEEPEAAEEEAEEPTKEDKTPEAAKEGKKKAEAEDDGKPLVFDDVEEKPSTVAENGWTEVAKELGFEIEKDDFDEFKTGFNKAKEINLAKLKPETQRLHKFTEAGGSIEDFVEPLRKYDEAISLSDADIVARKLFSDGWQDEVKRNAKIAQMEETGELEVVAANTRKILIVSREEQKNKIIDDRIKAQERYDEKLRNAPKEEAKLIKSTLEARKEFMGTQLSADNVAKIVKKYEAGEYNEAFKDTDTIAEFLLYKEFGKKGMQNLKIAAEREFKIKNKEKFHNIPPKVGKVGSKRATANPSGQDPEGNWDVLEKERVSKKA